MTHDNTPKVVAILPAYNEEGAIGAVVRALPTWIARVVVVDNASSDGTADAACLAGADVITEPHRGYGAACLAGIAAAPSADIYLFLDADGSDRADEAERLIAPIVAGKADLVIGSRVLGVTEPGAMTAPQVFGNWLAAFLLRAIWGVRCTDLGPFRAITRTALAQIDMRDRDFGWTVEMQARAYALGLRVIETPVSRLRRSHGRSKISGTVSGVVRAGAKILWVIGREAWFRRARGRRTGPSPEAPVPIARD